MCSLHGAEFRYRHRGEAIFANVDFSLAPGDRLAVTGASGSGKSTLLNILGLLEPISAGAHHFSGRPVHAAKARERAAIRANAIGFVFQAFHLVPQLTVIENVVLGARYGDGSGVPREEGMELLRRVGLERYARRRPLQLSGGEQQRVAVARALMARPRLVLCDEPTGNLDSRSADVVLECLGDALSASCALVVVTHDERVVERFPARAVVSDGGIWRL